MGTALEERIEQKPTLWRRFAEQAKDYAVDTSAAWMYYTTTMGLVEYFVAGMEPREVACARLFGMVVQAGVMRGYGKLREYWTRLWNVDADSSKTKKFLADTSFSVLYQIPVYSAILYCSGASLEEAAVALPAGLAVGAVSGRPYGRWLDYWRKKWKRDPTLD